METQNPNRSLLFWILFGFLAVNMLSITVMNQYLPVVRFFRQPALGLVLILVIHFFPRIEISETSFKPILRFFRFGIFYLVFNVLTSLDKVNSANYAIWMAGLFFFLYQLLIQRNALDFHSTLLVFSLGCMWLGIILLISSYLGGYVFDIDSFFDERFNYTIGTMKTEFAGVFGSNNSLGMCAFYTASLALLLSRLAKNQWKTQFYFGLALVVSALIFQIGNRASMVCIIFLWVGYFTWVRASVVGLVAMAMALVIGAVTFQEEITEKLRLEQFEGGNLLGNRAELFSEAIEITENMDFFGVGYQNQRLSRKYFHLVSENDKEYNFHNTYLAVIAELGWLGLLWIPGFILFGLFLYGSSSEKPPQNRSSLRMISLILLTACLFHLPVEDAVNSPGSAFFLWFWGLFFILLLGKSETQETNA